MNGEFAPERNWKEMLMEDDDYRKTIEELEVKIEAGRKTEMEMRKIKNDKEFSRHMGLVKEYRKWSNEVYTPKTYKIYGKSDAYGKTGDQILTKGYEEYLKRDDAIRKHGGYPYHRTYLDRWDPTQYDPWSIAKESLTQTTAFSTALDPLGLQERHFLEEARGLHLLEDGPKTGIPPLRAMKPWLQMPYSYYAWQNSGKWTRHWNGIDDKVPEIPSVCLSEGGEGGVNEATDTGKNTG